MLIQEREDRLRLIKQHDHALLAGKLAYSWRGLSSPAWRLRYQLVLATALHDLSWSATDLSPRLNAESQRPYSFIDYPLDDRVALYRAGINELERIDPYVALLISRFYCQFEGMEQSESFQQTERQRRAKLSPYLELTDEEVSHDLAMLKLLDLMSLFICLAPPSARPDQVPSWLTKARQLDTPQGDQFELDWSAEDELTVEPFPFTDVLWVDYSFLDLPQKKFEDGEVLRQQWAKSERRSCRVRIRPKAVHAQD